MPEGRYVAVSKMGPLDLRAHPDYELETQRCAWCGVEKDALLFDVLTRRHPTRLSDTCLQCERAVGVAG